MTAKPTSVWRRALFYLGPGLGIAAAWLVVIQPALNRTPQPVTAKAEPAPDAAPTPSPVGAASPYETLLGQWCQTNAWCREQRPVTQMAIYNSATPPTANMPLGSVNHVRIALTVHISRFLEGICRAGRETVKESSQAIVRFPKRTPWS